MQSTLSSFYQESIGGRLFGVMRRIRKRLRPPKKELDVSIVPPVADTDVPDHDTVAAEFDNAVPRNPERMVVIFSTPRSGSTYLCDLLRRTGFGVAHEFFEPDRYLPMFARRWGCVDDQDRISWANYVSCLERYRTSPEGILTMNVHGRQLPWFEKAFPHFTAPAVDYIWLVRRDKLRQAVSFELAWQTGQWSSQSKKTSEANFDFDRLRRTIRAIHGQDDSIAAYVHARGLYCEMIYYEDVVRDPRSAILGAFGVDIGDAAAANDRLAVRRQSGLINEKWVSTLAKTMAFGSNG